MPFEKSKLELNAIAPDNKIAPEPEDLGYLDVLPDAFKIDSGFSAFIRMAQDDKQVDLTSEFDPVEQAELDNIPVDYIDDLVFANNKQEYDSLLKEIQGDVQSRERLADAGWAGFFASMTAGVASPSSFIGGGAIANFVKAGVKPLKAGIGSAAITGGVVGAEEKLLQATQYGRTDEEVWLNTAASAAFAGLIGAGVTGLKNKQSKELSLALRGVTRANSKVNDGKLPTQLGEMASFDESIGAAKASLNKEQLGPAKSDNPLVNKVLDGYLEVNKKFNPTVRMMTSASKSAREAFVGLVDPSIKPQFVKEGIPLDEPVERALRRRYGQFSREVLDFKTSYSNYRKSVKGQPDKLSYMQFRREVGKAVRSVDDHPNQFVKQAADRWKKYYDEVADEIINLKLLPEDIKTPQEGARYLNRRWLIDEIKNNRNEFKRTIEPWYRSQLKSIEARLRSEVGEIDKKTGKASAKALDAQEQLNKYFDTADDFEDYLNTSIDSTISNLIKTNTKAGFQAPVAGKAGVLKKRSFNIPDEIVQDYLDNDILFLADSYTRSVVPQIIFKKRFGDETLETTRDRITQEYNDIISKTDDKAKVAKLIKENEEVLADLDTMWNLLQGTYKDFKGPMDGFMRRAADAVRTLNYMRLLGGVVISSLPDVGVSVLRQGFKNSFGKSFKPFIKNSKFIGENMSKSEARSYGLAVEYVSSMRTQSLFSIGDPMSFGTPFENFINKAGNWTSNINLINFWNDTMQTIATLGTRFRIVDNVQNYMQKGKVTKKDQEWLAFMGLGESDFPKINRMLEEFGTKDSQGTLIPNVDSWTDISTKKKFISAIQKEVNRTVLTKGTADIPRFGNTLLGKLMFQFQNFNFAFNNKILISGMQDADGRTLAGFGTLISLGMFTHALKELEAGRELPDNPVQWIEAGMDRSGFLGLIAYGNSYAEALTGNGYKQLLGEEPNKYAGFGSLSETALGPTGGTLRKFKQLGQSMFKDGFTQKDVHNARSLMPWQNVVYMKNLFNALEEGVNKGFNLPPDRRSKKKKLID